uniref:Retrovirus-related Pol polyprotein from transposon TNT 1-94 n=1 Tax=Tanacetum cinerariifolium TaxID=118510 RepID=A0A6L2KEB7_TANCI|nr:retrovirus-related Pol polyprotein from transposon TNT 1-94 [Tanacetum cinerariifolium]
MITMIQSVQNDEILNDDHSKHSNHINDEQIIDNLPNTKDIQISTHSSSLRLKDALVQNTSPIANSSLSIPSMVTPAPQDRWSQYKHIELVSIIGDPRAGCSVDPWPKNLLLGGKLVCWSAKKKQSIAMSSAEAEYVAAVGWYNGEIRAKVTRKKSFLPPRFISLLLEYIMPKYDNEELTINPTQVSSVHNWALKPNQAEGPPFTDYMKAIYKLYVPMESKASKSSSQTKEVPQGKKLRATSELKRNQSSKHTSEFKTEASKSKTGQSKMETFSISLILS